MYRYVLLLIPFVLWAQPTRVAGPMVGFSEMRQIRLWVQTTQSARVAIRYADTADPTRWYWTETITTARPDAYTAHLLADSVQPGRIYRYELYIDGTRIERSYPFIFRTPPLWQWRGDPPPLRIALGSCAYVNDSAYDRPGEPYGGDQSIYRAIAQQQPHIMLWLGDNIYLREADWNSWTGIVHRYTYSRRISELEPLLASCSNYAIWDDHDYGPNDSDRGFANKHQTRRAFDLFWVNPPTALNGGITTAFSWSDCDFFLLDNRWWRSPNKRHTGERTILGQEQFEWLIDNLVTSQATFKFVCIGGQVLNPVAQYETYATYPEERKRLIDAVRREGIRNVIFLTGDRHHTELTCYREGDSLIIYDLTVSPLTSRPNHSALTEANFLRVEDTLVTQRNFATIDVEGPHRQRNLRIRVYDSTGTLLWERTIQAQEQPSRR